MSHQFIANLLLDREEISNLLSLVDPSDTKVSSEFFDRFGFSHLVISGNYAQALHLGRSVLELVQLLDEAKFVTMHKGTPYYWMGMAAYLLANFETAVYLMDASVAEDVKNDPGSTDTPSRLFFRLESENPNQAAQKLTEDAERQLTKHLGEYNKIIETYDLAFDKLSINSLRRRILEPATLSGDPNQDRIQ